MSKIEKISSDLENLRIKLNILIAEKKDLLDPEIIIASQMLDSALNRYHKVIIKKMSK
ncbi:aspartyl-phosphate phosphatase Spo0E family protein [Clostridium tyrobutyricum]|uniref:aspartyl-phosphate phosphatase Spo0E family protein n=1 Tax=Clostridium tyrobutyricum TaxID=1519 RepID=UPI001C390D2F|nr:aspartyl-phosphate phosphatase Spo0E family protein [Clostridium tyrobutyricum]MBV4419684.1 aspartyl-phosphate phosphatase Spo0E family protein [Clostridium tyrobutyricum]